MYMTSQDSPALLVLHKRHGDVVVLWHLKTWEEGKG